ncbi:hypothetical protein QJS04_geneDACA022254 [Acorus gramineus]|uniref:C2 domain-containing protein n=1 Tax=Acorus gramineus TaxID=55184 RepID=A0AAV9BDR8_ACOGR|nr:hypothetical protein QJS04_geneDACA022254 [Acorus gramineus]
MDFKKNNHHNHQLTIEVTVISAQSLKKPTSLFSHRRLRPYVTLSADNPPPPPTDKIYRTRVVTDGSVNPTWGDKLRLPVGPGFFQKGGGDPGIVVHVFNNSGGFSGQEALLGWCRIPASDVVDGLHPPGTVHRLSYGLMCKDGSKGEGVVNFAVCVVGLGPVTEGRLPQAPTAFVGSGGWGQTAVGIPVSDYRVIGGGQVVGVVVDEAVRRDDVSSHWRFSKVSLARNGIDSFKW